MYFNLNVSGFDQVSLCTVHDIGTQYVNLVSKSLQAATHNGRTALHEAAESGHNDICQLLLSVGADPQAKNKVRLCHPQYLYRPAAFTL